MRFLVITSILEDKTIDTKKSSTSQIFEYSSLNEAILNFRTFQQMSSWKVMYLVVDFETMNQGLGLLKPKDNMEVDSVDLPYFIICQHTWDKPRSEFIRRDRTQVIADGIVREFNNNVDAMRNFLEHLRGVSHTEFRIVYKRKRFDGYFWYDYHTRKISDSTTLKNALKKYNIKRFIIHPPKWTMIKEDEIVMEK